MLIRYSLSGGSNGHQTPTHPSQPSTLSSSISLSQPRHMAATGSRRASCRTSYGGPGHSTYLPPPQFADGQSSVSECSDSNFSMMSSSGITIATLPRRCHATNSINSDTQPLIMASSFRTLPRQPPPSQQSGHGGPQYNPGQPQNHIVTESTVHSQTLPLKSSLKKTSVVTANNSSVASNSEQYPDNTGNLMAGGSMEELRV